MKGRIYAKSVQEYDEENIWVYDGRKMRMIGNIS